MLTVTSRIGHAKADGGESPLAGTSVIDLRNNLQGIEALYALSFADMTRRHRPVLHARIVASLIALDSALHAPSIEHVDGSTVLTLTEKMSDDFEEVALVLEMEGTRPRE